MALFRVRTPPENLYEVTTNRLGSDPGLGQLRNPRIVGAEHWNDATNDPRSTDSDHDTWAANNAGTSSDDETPDYTSGSELSFGGKP